MDKYYVTSYDYDTREFSVSEVEGTMFYYKGFVFGMNKYKSVDGTVIVTELSSGLKLNCNAYNPRTKDEAVKTIGTIYDAIVKRIKNKEYENEREIFIKLVNEAESKKESVS